MTRWLGWFVAWLSVFGLLWILDRQAGVSPPVGPSIDLWSNAGPTLSHVFLSRSPVFTRIRTDALGSSAPRHACMTPGDGGPPWLDSRGPPGACGGTFREWRLPATPAVQTRGRARVLQ